jgi:hypothetical protein
VRNVYKILVSKPDGKRPLERPRCRWEDIIRHDLKETRCEVVDWIHLAQDKDQWWAAAVNTVMNFWVP